MKVCKLLSVCLMYPSEQWQGCIANLKADFDVSSLKPFVEYISSNKLIALQEEYVATFDLNTKNSLYIFEHIHGDDKQRGMALVNLKEEYENNSYTLDENELVDYIPAFLEFVAQLDEQLAFEYIHAAADVFVLLYQRLKEQNNIYQYVFYLLIQSFGLNIDAKLMLDNSKQNVNEGTDNYSCTCI